MVVWSAYESVNEGLSIDKADGVSTCYLLNVYKCNFGVILNTTSPKGITVANPILAKS